MPSGAGTHERTLIIREAPEQVSVELATPRLAPVLVQLLVGLVVHPDQDQHVAGGGRRRESEERVVAGPLPGFPDGKRPQQKAEDRRGPGDDPAAVTAWENGAEGGIHESRSQSRRVTQFLSPS